MNCTQIQEELVALIQGELDGAQTADVQAHVGACPACREALEDLRSALEASRVIPPIEPSAQFRERLQARLAMARKAGGASVRMSRPRESWRFRYFALAAAMLLLTVGISQFIVVSKATNDEKKLRIEMAQQRWSQRSEAPRWEALLNGADVQLPPDVKADTLVAVAHRDSNFQENCVALFTDQQIEALKADPRIDREQLGRMLARSVRVTVENGQIRLPGPMLLRSLPGAESGVALLKLNGRFELWSEKTLRVYLQQKPDIEMTLPESKQDGQNLPPEANGGFESAAHLS